MTARRFLTTSEIADLLRIRERKVYDLVSAGAIPVCRVTGKLLFPRDLVEAWVERGIDYDGDIRALRPLPPVVAGSHDPLLDWALRESRSGLATICEGSLAGLEKLASGEAQAAGLHIFEPENGGWNRVHVARAPGLAGVVLIEWAARRQGLVVAPGNPHAIGSIDDLAGRTVMFRQEGAGSRVLLQHLIERAGVARQIVPAGNVAVDESDVARAVAVGEADTGLAIEAVVRQFGLDFVPVVEERFDLAMHRHAYFEEPVQRLLGLARTGRFAERAAELGGYDISRLGEVRLNGRR